MNKKRNEYVYHLVGVINKKIKREPREGKFVGSYFWNLAVEIEAKPGIGSINVFANSLENKAIWEAIEKTQYLGKTYTFFCRNHRGSYYLINWEERSNSSLKETNYE